MLGSRGTSHPQVLLNFFSRLSEAPIPSFVTYKARDFLNMDTSQFCDGGMLTERESFLKTLYVAPRSMSRDVGADSCTCRYIIDRSLSLAFQRM